MDRNSLSDVLDTQLNREEGTISFKISYEKMGNLFDPNLEQVVLIDKNLLESRFILARIKNSFVFENWDILTGRRFVEVNFGDKKFIQGIYVAFTWSKEKISLHIGGKPDPLMQAESSESFGKIKLGKDGNLYQIGDKGVEVGMYSIRNYKGEKILEVDAKEHWDFTVVKVRHLISDLEKDREGRDFLFETLLAQQIIVMLVTGLEVYFKKRFFELNGKYVYRIKEHNLFFFKVKSKKKVKQNFQNHDFLKKAYKSIGINLASLEGSIPSDWEKVRKFIEYRHNIIHSDEDMSILNSRELPRAAPVFANKSFAIECVNHCEKYLNLLQKDSEKVKLKVDQ